MEMMKLTEKDIRTIGELAGDPERLDKQDYKNVTVLTLVTEIERLRAVVAQQAAEIAKVREVMEEYRAALLPFADCYQNEVPESDKALFKNRVLIDVTVADVLRAAMVKRDIEEGLPDSLLDAKPDAAPVEPAARRPMLGDTLKNAITEGKRVFVKATGERGIVFSIFSTEGGRKYRVEHGGEYADYNRDEIELAPVEAAAAREIAVGDRVRITIEGSIREGAKGKVIAINPDYEACYAVELVATNGKHFVIGDYRPGEIELV